MGCTSSVEKPPPPPANTGAASTGADPKATTAQPSAEKPKSEPDPPKAKAGGGPPPPALQGETLPPQLVEGLTSFQAAVGQQSGKGGPLYVSCLVTDATPDSTLLFGVLEANGTVHSQELTGKQLHTRKDLQPVKWSIFFQSLWGQVNNRQVKVKGEGAYALTFDIEKKPWKVDLERKDQDPATLHKLFLEPLMAFMGSLKDPAKAKDEERVLEVERRLNVSRANVYQQQQQVEVMTNAVEPLRNAKNEKSAAMQRKREQNFALAKKIRQLQNPGCTDLYRCPRAFVLHTPHSDPHDPTVKPANAVLNAAIQVQYTKDTSCYVQPQADDIPPEPVSADLQRLLADAPAGTHGAVLECLARVDEWDFDVWKLAEVSDGQPLFVMTYALCWKYGLPAALQMDNQTLVDCLLAIESGYHANPLHNALCAADVVQAMHYIIHVGRMREVLRMTAEDCFACIFASATHDYDHPGLNNNFHIRTNAYLALLYNDRNVLQQHACTSVFEMLKDPKYNVLAKLRYDSTKDVRDSVVDLIINADVGTHVKVLSAFQRKLADEQEWSKKDDMRLGMSIAMKMAGGTKWSRPIPLYAKWAKAIADEWYFQGEKEAALGLQVSPFMDRAKHRENFATSQRVYMQQTLRPMYEAVAKWLPKMEFAVVALRENREAWKTSDALRQALKL